jgi:predicted DNA-binding protein
MNQTPQDTPEFETLSVRLTKDTAAAFKRVAAATYRPTAAELRRLIEERIAEFEAEEMAA